MSRTHRLERRVAKECLLWALVVGVPLGVACGGGDPSNFVNSGGAPGSTPAQQTATFVGTAMPASPPVQDEIVCAIVARRDTETGQPRCEDDDGPLRAEPTNDPVTLAAFRDNQPPAAGSRQEVWETRDLNVGSGEGVECEVNVEGEGDLPPGSPLGATCTTASDVADATVDAGSSLPDPSPPGESANPSGATHSAKRETDSAAVVASGNPVQSDQEILSRTTCPNGSNGYEVRVVTREPPVIELILVSFSTCDGVGSGDVGASTPVVVLDGSDVISGCGNVSDIVWVATGGEHVFATVTCSIDSQNRVVGAHVPETDPASASFEVLLAPSDVVDGFEVVVVGSSLDADANGQEVVVVNGPISANTPGGSPAFIAITLASPVDSQQYTAKQVIGPGEPPGYTPPLTVGDKVTRSGPGDQLPGDPQSPPLWAPVGALHNVHTRTSLQNAT